MGYSIENKGLINAGLTQLGDIVSTIAKVEQVTPEADATTKMYVKSIMLYANIEQIIAIDQGTVLVPDEFFRQLKLNLQQIIKTNIP